MVTVWVTHSTSGDEDTLQCQCDQGTPESVWKGGVCVIRFLATTRVAVPMAGKDWRNVSLIWIYSAVSQEVEGVSPCSTSGIDGAASVGA